MIELIMKMYIYHVFFLKLGLLRTIYIYIYICVCVCVWVCVHVCVHVCVCVCVFELHIYVFWYIIFSRNIWTVKKVRHMIYTSIKKVYKFNDSKKKTLIVGWSSNSVTLSYDVWFYCIFCAHLWVCNSLLGNVKQTLWVLLRIQCEFWQKDNHYPQTIILCVV